MKVKQNAFTQSRKNRIIKRLSVSLFFILLFSTNVFSQSVGSGTIATFTPSGGFAIDGDLQANIVASGTGDWLKGGAGSGGFVFDSLGNALNGGISFHLTDNYGGNDNSFGGGDKANGNPNGWSWSAGSVNGKTDINNVLIHFSTDVNGHQWLIVAADRSSNSGSAYLDFEFLQAPLTVNPNGTFTSTGPNGGRTAGDFSLTFLSSGGTFILETWQGSGSSYNYVTSNAPAGSVYGASNASSVPVSFGAFGSTTYASGTFTEGAIDLTALLGSVNPCTQLAIKTIFVKTKTSAAASASIMDFVNPLQVKLQLGVAQPGADQTKCSTGASTLFTMAGAATASPGDFVKTIAWRLISGTGTIADSTSLTSGVQITSASATLQLTIMTNNGCTASGTVNLTVNSTPTAAINGTSASSVCSSSPIVLTASTNQPGSIYLWSPGNATTSSISVSPGSSATYSLTVTGTNGCASGKATKTLAVNNVPTVTLDNVSLCEGQYKDLCSHVSGTTSPDLTYEWSNGLDVACFTVTVPNTYSVVVTDGFGCTATASLNVALIQPPNLKVTASKPLPVKFCNGDSVTLTATGAATYLWTGGSTTSSIKVKSDGLYSVTGSSAPGCIISVLTYVTVTPGPTVTITPNGSTTFCQGGSVKLTASGASTYAWGNGATTLFINASTNATYSVVGTDASGCKGSASQVVTVNPLPNVTLAPINPVCINQGVIDLNGGSPVGGTFSGPGVSTNAFNPAAAGGIGTYTITYSYTNANSCTNTATASLSVNSITSAPGAISGPASGVCANTSKTYSIAPVSGALSYSWATSGGISVTSGQGSTSVTLSFSPSFVSGFISVSANGPCGFSTASTLVINSYPNAPSQILGNANPCKAGKNVYWVTPVTGATTYTWTVPAGSSIASGQGTASITVNTGKKSGSITVKASNACGDNGTAATLAINTGCRTMDPVSGVPIDIPDNSIAATIYPNPAHDVLNVLFMSNTEDIYTLRIFDMMGKLVVNQVRKSEIGDNVIQLNLNLAKGLYVVSLTSGELSKQSKIVVE